jgi:hypothetical protein
MYCCMWELKKNHKERNWLGLKPINVTAKLAVFAMLSLRMDHLLSLPFFFCDFLFGRNGGMGVNWETLWTINAEQSGRVGNSMTESKWWGKSGKLDTQLSWAYTAASIMAVVRMSWHWNKTSDKWESHVLYPLTQPVLVYNAFTDYKLCLIIWLHIFTF